MTTHRGTNISRRVQPLGKRFKLDAEPRAFVTTENLRKQILQHDVLLWEWGGHPRPEGVQLCGVISLENRVVPADDGATPHLCALHINRVMLRTTLLDDWGLEPLDALARHDLLEILEERYGRRSTIVTSQLPIASWHHVIADPTYADAILDRLVHNAHRLDLEGDSMRRSKNTPDA